MLKKFNKQTKKNKAKTIVAVLTLSPLLVMALLTVYALTVGIYNEFGIFGLLFPTYLISMFFAIDYLIDKYMFDDRDIYH